MKHIFYWIILLSPLAAAADTKHELHSPIDGMGTLDIVRGNYIYGNVIDASNILVDHIDFLTNPLIYTWKEGRVYYASDTGSLSVYSSRVGTELKIGKKLYQKSLE